MSTEFDYILERNQDEMIKELEGRFEYDEALTVSNILIKKERYLTQLFTTKHHLDAWNEMKESWLLTMGETGDLAGPFYGNIIRKIEELEQLLEQLTSKYK